MFITYLLSLLMADSGELPPPDDKPKEKSFTWWLMKYNGNGKIQQVNWTQSKWDAQRKILFPKGLEAFCFYLKPDGTDELVAFFDAEEQGMAYYNASAKWLAKRCPDGCNPTGNFVLARKTFDDKGDEINISIGMTVKQVIANIKFIYEGRYEKVIIADEKEANERLEEPVKEAKEQSEYENFEGWEINDFDVKYDKSCYYVNVTFDIFSTTGEHVKDLDIEYVGEARAWELIGNACRDGNLFDIVDDKFVKECKEHIDEEEEMEGKEIQSVIPTSMYITHGDWQKVVDVKEWMYKTAVKEAKEQSEKETSESEEDELEKEGWENLPGQTPEVIRSWRVQMAGGGSHAWWYLIEHDLKKDQYNLYVERMGGIKEYQGDNKVLEHKLTDDGCEYLRVVDGDPSEMSLFFPETTS